MADKNKTAEEDYLDSLLKSITGGTEEENEEDFLADFEKEFLGDGDDDLEPDFDVPQDITKKEAYKNPQLEEVTLTEAVKKDTQPKIEPEEKIEPFVPEQVEEEKVEEPVFEESSVESNEPEEEINISDEMLFDIDSDIIGAIDEAVTEENEEVSNPFKADMAMVEEAIENSDTSVEEDLKGLYDILGMDGSSEELPDDIEDTPKKKKKGFFAKLKEKKEASEKEDKKSKDKKKEKKSKDKKKISNEEKLSKEAETLDVGDLFEQAEIIDDGDFGDLDIASLGGEPSSSSDDFGLDDSIFNNMDEGESEAPSATTEFDDEEIFFEEEEESKKKEKKEKKKKEKKKKEKKEKAPKKKKPKKEKKPKEPDEIIHISKVFILFAISFVAVIVLVAKIGGDYYSYNEKFYKAIALYVYGNDIDEGQTLDQDKFESKFQEAYAMIGGLTMKEKDHETFYKQLETIMIMDSHYESYKRYMLLEDFDHGLDSLIKAVKMYDKYQNIARDLKCFDEMTLVLSWVDNSLQTTYGISQSQARELYMIKDDDDYAVKVRAIAATARANYEKNNIEEE